MPREYWVYFRMVVEVNAEEGDLDDAWEQAVEILRDSGGDIIGHSIVDAKSGSVLEESS